MTTPVKLPLPAVSNYGNYSSDNYGAHTLMFTVKGIDFYFSYQTLVAFFGPKNGRVVQRNYWGKTTGKHLNWIDHGRKDERVDQKEFERRLRNELGEDPAPEIPA